MGLEGPGSEVPAGCSTAAPTLSLQIDPFFGLRAWRRRSQGDRDRRTDPKTLRQAEEKTNTATFFSLRSPGTHLREVRSYNAPRLVVAKRTNLLLFFLLLSLRAGRVPVDSIVLA